MMWPHPWINLLGGLIGALVFVLAIWFPCWLDRRWCSIPVQSDRNPDPGGAVDMFKRCEADAQEAAQWNANGTRTGRWKS